jgi:NADH:ubiquinone reductase (H+-translocating)
MAKPGSTDHRIRSAADAGGGSRQVLVLGGGYVGLYTALRLQRRLRPREATVTVVDPRSYMTYQPFLPEAAAGSLSPRHVVVPLRRVLKRCEVINGHAVGLDHANRSARIKPIDGPEYDLPYDVVVVAVGSIARTLPIPGLADRAVGFKAIEEAIYLRNQVLTSLDLAESTRDAGRRRRALSFCFVGAGYAGVEALAELEDLARDAMRSYKRITPADLNFVLVEATGRILPEVGEDMGRYTVRELEARDIRVALDTRLESCADGVVRLSDGTTFESDTIVWTAGVKASPALERFGLPLDDRGRLRCLADLRVEGVEGAWGAGDACAVPDLTRPGQLCGPAGQGAGGQHRGHPARQAGEGLPARLRGVRGQPRVAQGRRAGLRGQAQGLAGLVHAPDLPPVPGADPQPQDPGGRGLDPGPVLLPGDRLARRVRAAVPRVRAGCGQNAAAGLTVRVAPRLAPGHRPALVAQRQRQAP